MGKTNTKEAAPVDEQGEAEVTLIGPNGQTLFQGTGEELSKAAELMEEQGGDGTGTVTVPRGLRPLAAVASKDKERPGMCGVHVVGDADRMVFAATDGFRFVKVTREAGAGERCDPVTVKTEDWKRGLEHVAKTKEERAENPDVAFSYEGGKVEIDNDGGETSVTIVGEPCGGQFPNVDGVIPRYALMNDVSGDDEVQLEAVACTVNAVALARLLKAMAEMTPGAVTLEAPRSLYQPLVVKAEFAEGGIIEAVMMPYKT